MLTRATAVLRQVSSSLRLCDRASSCATRAGKWVGTAPIYRFDRVTDNAKRMREPPLPGTSPGRCCGATNCGGLPTRAAFQAPEGVRGFMRGSGFPKEARAPG